MGLISRVSSRTYRDLIMKNRTSIFVRKSTVNPHEEEMSFEPTTSPTIKVLQRCVALDPTNISIAILDRNREILHAVSMHNRTFLHDLIDFTKIMKHRAKKSPPGKTSRSTSRTVLSR